ncbi:MAG TPA: arylamine N-acetyltransferase [Solirubrobacteraceae bacterium]|nr:arylamine N-acetyltransferase [Solirubrobacteraceae bacterium]
MSRLDTAAYLQRLRLPAPGAPSAEGLRALHQAHVERVSYEALEIQLGRPTTVDPHESAARILGRHRGGYCFHLNGAFSLLLDALGYDVVWHRGGIQTHADPEPVGAGRANHLALTVHGLPTEESPSGDWLVDVGLGDALHGPLPLHEGTYAQGPFRYALRRSEIEPGGWRWDHDASGGFVGMDFRAGPAWQADFHARHAFLSTSPESGFVRTSSVQRRDAGGVDILTGCMLGRLGEGAREPVELETSAEWFGALCDVFDLPLTDVDAASRAALWARVRAAHEACFAV